MATAYPSNIDAYMTHVNGQVIAAQHVNDPQDAIVAVENALGKNPLTISDTTTPGATPAYLGAYINGSNIGFASMIATQIRLMTGGAAWWTAPVTTLAALNARLGLPSSPVTGDMVYYNGSAWVRLAIGTAGQLLDVVGGIPSWQTIGAAGVGAIPAPASPVTGDLLYYNGASWVRLAIGTAGQSLIVSGGIPTWISSVPGSLNDGIWTKWNAGSLKVDLKLRLPAVVASDGTVTEYATIQNAITAATSGQWVVVPPGTYTENLTLTAGVNVAELIRGSVIIAGSITTANNCIVAVDQVHASTLIVASHTGTGANGFTLIARYVYFADSAGGTVYGVNQSGAGDTTVIGTYFNIDKPFGTGEGIHVTAGTVKLFQCRFLDSLNDINNVSGTVQIYDCQYDITKTSGTLTFLTGDRMRGAQISLHNQCFS